MLQESYSVILRKHLKGRAVAYSVFVGCVGLFAALLTVIPVLDAAASGWWTGWAVALWLVTAYSTYWMVWALRLRGDLGDTVLATVQGYGLSKQEQYHHSVQAGDVRLPVGPALKSFFIEIDGQQYVWPRELGMPPEDCAVEIHFATIASPMWRGKRARVVVDVHVLEGEALAQFEAQSAQVWDKSALAENQAGHMTIAQRRALYREHMSIITIVGGLLTSFGIGGLVLGMMLWGSPDATTGKMILLGVVTFICLGGGGVFVQETVSTLRDIRGAHLARFTGVLERRQTTPGGTYADGGVSLWHGEQRYEVVSESLFQHIPETTPATYYYADMPSRTIVNYEL